MLPLPLRRATGDNSHVSSTKVRDPVYQERDDLRTQARWQTVLIKEQQAEIKRLRKRVELYEKKPKSNTQRYHEKKGRYTTFRLNIIYPAVQRYCKANDNLPFRSGEFQAWFYKAYPEHAGRRVGNRIRELWSSNGLLEKLGSGLYRLA